MAVSLLSFSPKDNSYYSVSFPIQSDVSNLGGAVGAELAAHGIFQLGLAVSFLPILLMATGALLIRSERKGLDFIKLYLIGSAVIMTMIYLLETWSVPFRVKGIELMPGGWIGHSMKESSDQAFGKAILWIVIFSAVCPFLFVRSNALSRFFSSAKMLLRKKRKLSSQSGLEHVTQNLEKEDSDQLGTVNELNSASLFKAQTNDLEPSAIEAAGRVPAPLVFGDEMGSHQTTEIPDKSYRFPSLEMFKRSSLSQLQGITPAELKRMDDLLIKTLADFGINAEVIGHQSGPVVTVYEVRPEAGIKQARLLGLADDLALSLKADSLLIQPIPEKSALGIQVPNQLRQDVLMGELLDHPTFARLSSPLSFVIGKSISGQPIYADLGAMPHLLVAGSTGSGKSVGINTLITSLLARSSPKEVRMILVDPKMLELSVYEGIPHLLMPVITRPEKATSALRWAAHEMDRRYRVMQQMQVRNIGAFNQAWLDASADTREGIKAQLNDTALDTLPYIVLIIDELADLMMTAPKDIEALIQRLAQKARASGIHMVLATQRPSVDIITGVIKANLPSRIAFQVVSKHDSRTILDQMGAEKLLGKGDLLLQRPGINKLERIQGAYVSDSEVVNFVKSIKENNSAQYDLSLIDWIDREAESDEAEGFSGEAMGDDLRWDDALDIAKSQGQVSASYLQRQLKIGYNRAARIVEQMEKMGLVGKADGSKPRRWLGQTGQDNNS